MDSTNGRSEKNQAKNIEDFLKLIQESDFKKVSINDLPFDEQEKIKEFMELIGDDAEPELLIADFKMQVEDLALVPMEILSDMYRDAIVDENFEDAQDIGEEIKKRGYSIDISDKSLTLKRKDKESD